MRKKLIVTIILSILLAVVGHLLVNSYKLNLCFSDSGTNTYDVTCHSLLERIGDPLFYGMSALAVIFLILFLVPSAFNAWKKFAIWFVPLMAIIFAVYKGPSGGFMDPTPYPKQVFLWLSILYVAISLIIIAFSLYKSQNKNKK